MDTRYPNYYTVLDLLPEARIKGKEEERALGNRCLEGRSGMQVCNVCLARAVSLEVTAKPSV